MKHTHQSVRAAYKNGQNIFRRPSVEALILQIDTLDDICGQAERERVAAEKERNVLRLQVAALEAALKHVYTEAFLKYQMTHEQAQHLADIVRPLLQPDTQRDGPHV